MTAPLVFVDCETDGLRPDRRVWEVAMIRRDDDGERETSLFVDIDLSDAEPMALKVGRFYERHPFFGDSTETVWIEASAASEVERWTRGAHLVGAVPSFDAECLDVMLRRNRLVPAWHHHLIDVEAMAVGYLSRGAYPMGVEDTGKRPRPWETLPWKSDDLSRACGVEPPSGDERHTALGDARWAMRWYDAMTGGQA